jgi:predicted ATPase
MLDALFVNKANEVHLRISSIRVSFFNLESMNTMLSDLLKVDTATVLSLSSLILRKTHGNAYFVFKFLESLQADGLLFYSKASHRWEWNHDRIQAETNVSENVVSLITSRIRKMNTHVQAVVGSLSCLSFSLSCVLCCDWSS